MVELATLQAVSYIMGSLGVFVAAVYYVMNIQNNRRNQELTLKAQQQTLETRKADILQRFLQVFASQDYADEWHDVVFNQNFLTYDEWQRDYGPSVNPDAYSNFAALITYHEALGGLLRENLISIELVERTYHPLHLICVWDRVEPVIKKWREKYHADSLYENFEYMFNLYMERHPEAQITRSDWHKEMLELHESKIRKT